MRAILCAVTSLAVLGVPSPARGGHDEGTPSELDLFKLDAEVREIVTTITKTQQELREAPSVVSVITREDIRARGYRSIAEVLADTAGFHVIDDHVLPDAGVRGVHGGVNGSSRLLKLMIDGQPVDYRPTTGYTIGPELIPIEIVERIEIIRGPVSALYGADAFLGVVSIITRKGGELRSFGISLRGAGMETDAPPSAPRRRLGVSVFGGTLRDNLEVVGAVSYDEIVRSGLSLPTSSPHYDRYAEDPYSAHDHARPRSFYGRMSLDAGKIGLFRLSGWVSRTDADSEWNDTAVEVGRDLALTHGTHVELENRHLRLEWNRSFGEVGLVSSIAWSEGEVGGGDVIDVRRADLRRVRRQSYRAFDVVLEGRYQPSARFALVAGADYSIDLQEPQRTYSLYDQQVEDFAPGDLRLIEPARPDRTFRNEGVYAQVIYHPIPSLGVTAGVRLDHHSLYELVPNGRLGLVYLLGRAAYSKLLIGTSFKAPSDDQLYAEPIYEGALAGNPRLAEQRATTAELVVGWDDGRIAAAATAFFTRINDKVDFELTGSALGADNISRLDTVGLEIEGRIRRAVGIVRLGVWANATLVDLTKRSTTVVATTDEEPFPSFVGNLGVDAAVPRWHVRLNARLHAVGKAPQTGSNILLLEEQDLPVEELDPYALVSITASTIGLEQLGGEDSVIAAGITNLFDTHYDQPGTGGVNIPGSGRTFFLSVTQQW